MIDTDKFNDVYIEFLDALEKFDRHKGILTGRAVRGPLREMIRMLREWQRETFVMNHENKKRLVEMKEARKRLAAEKEANSGNFVENEDSTDQKGYTNV